MTIHHATLKRAAKFAIVLAEPEHGYFTATHGGKQIAEGSDAKKVLADAEAIVAPKPEKKAKVAKPKSKAKKSRKSSEEDEDGDEEGSTKSVIAPKYKAKYKPNKDTCGDDFVQTLFTYLHPDGEDVDQKLLVKLGKDNGVDVMDLWGHLKTKHGAFNVGMARMNLANVLRGKLRRGEDVVVGTKTLKGKKKD